MALAEKVHIHPWPVRLSHWLQAVAIVLMVGSGLRIYNASPLFDFRFPGQITFGGWLGGAIAIHLAAMWLLFAAFGLYLVHGVATGRLRRRLLPLSTAAVLRDCRMALTFRLHHEIGVYNAVQRALYLLVLVAIAGAILSGLAIWKPMQFAPLTWLLGGYDVARYVHFAAMAGIVLFLVVHIALVAIVPSVLGPMVTGRARLRSVAAAANADVVTP